MFQENDIIYAIDDIIEVMIDGEWIPAVISNIYVWYPSHIPVFDILTNTGLRNSAISDMTVFRKIPYDWS